jgi:Zn-dependent peptidase ImmA (M78 family)/DNA-binding XRE family transcriptional regulator
MRDEHQDQIGRTISRLREQQGWSQRQLAKWVGLDQSALSRIEAGRRRLSAKELQSFADAFHVSADALLHALPGDPNEELLGYRPVPAPEPRETPAGRSRTGRLGLPGSPPVSAFGPPRRRRPDPFARESRTHESPGAHLLDAAPPSVMFDAPDRPDGTPGGIDDIDEPAAWDGSAFSACPACPSDAPQSSDRIAEDRSGGDDTLELGGVTRGDPDHASVTDDGPDGLSVADEAPGLERDLAMSSLAEPLPASAARERRAPHHDPLAADPVTAPRPVVRGEGVPPEVASVLQDWFELRRLAGGGEPAPTWSLGHSAEGKPARLAQSARLATSGQGGFSGLSQGDVLYDRVARFWRSELHVEPDEGPLPDLVTLLEDGFGAQVIVARIAAHGYRGEHGRQSLVHPVAASLTAGDVPFLFVNAARPVVLQRFALAHAFAHLVLGHGDVVDTRIHWSRNNPREAAANDFTEEFLAPVRAVRRWYERHGEPRADVETLLKLANAFGISVWSALYRSRAAERVSQKLFGKLNSEMHAIEWELLPRQAFLGGLRDTLSHLTPAETLRPGEFGPPAVLRVPAAMRSCALTAVCEGRLSVERAAQFLRIDARELTDQLARLGLE